MPKRTDNEIKNYWNTHLKKRLTRLGIDPSTHKPRNDAVHGGHSKDAANISHMAQWESARLEAEARLAKESKQLQPKGNHQQPAVEPLLLTRLVLNKITPQPSPPPCLDVLKAWQTQNSSSASNSKPTTMHSMYAMMLATDDLDSPTSTLAFPTSNTTTATAAATAKPTGAGDDMMVGVEAFGYYDEECDVMELGEGVMSNNGDVVAYNEGNEIDKNSSSQQNLGIMEIPGDASATTDFEERHYWNTIFNWVDGLPSHDFSPV